LHDIIKAYGGFLGTANSLYANGGYLDATDNLYADGGLLDEDNIYALGGESFPSDMTLEEAFEKARERGQEYFYFNGKRYTTGLTADTKTYANGGSLVDGAVPTPSKQRPFTDEELINDAGEEFPEGIRRRNNGTYFAFDTSGRKVILSEEQVRDQLDKVRKRRVQEQTDALYNKYAEGGTVESQEDIPVEARAARANIPQEAPQRTQQVEQQRGEPELVCEAGQEFPSGIWRFPDGTYQAADAEGKRVVLSEKQVAAYIEMMQKRKAQQAQQQQFAEGGPMEDASAQMPPQGTSQEIPQEGMGNAEVPMEGGPQVQEEAPTEAPMEEEEPQESEEEPEEEEYEVGDVVEVSEDEAARLKAEGYKFKVIEK
jgi:hypothetical protein